MGIEGNRNPGGNKEGTVYILETAEKIPSKELGIYPELGAWCCK
jgi:hypothetical protein